MGRFIVNGGGTLRGTVRVSGSKNATLPIIFASIITGGVSKIENFPDIGDTRVALEIIEGMGAVISREGTTVYIDSRNMSYTPPSAELVSRLRGSTYLIGASLCRFGRAGICDFGGCNFSARPIDMHVMAAERFGAILTGCELYADRLCGCDIRFEKRSVGATVNSLIMASAAEGVTRIYGGAAEPHIMTLVDFLRSMGVEIEVTDGCITVVAGKMQGGCVRIPGDMIEAGTYMTVSMLTGGEVYACGFRPVELGAFMAALGGGGFEFSITEEGILAYGRQRRPIEISAAPYPAFPTDLQPVCAPLLAVGLGGRIRDRVFPSRFSYLSELSKLGVSYSVTDRGGTVYPSRCHFGRVRAMDLRGGASCLLLSLCTEGECVIEDAETILRGYENLVSKLRALGADVVYES